MEKKKKVKLKTVLVVALIMIFSCSVFGFSFLATNKPDQVENNIVAVDGNESVSDEKDDNEEVAESSYVVKNWNDVMLEKHNENLIMFDGGSGAMDDPFLISTPEQLAYMAYTKTNNIGVITGAFTGRMDQVNRNDNLPSQYVQLEYLESTGSEWINTGFTTATCDGFEIEFATTGVGNINNNKLNGIFGCNGTSDDLKIWYRYAEDAYTLNIQSTQAATFSADTIENFDLQGWHKIKYVPGAVYYNDELLTTVEVAPKKVGCVLGLFCVSNQAGSSVSYLSKTKVKSFKMYYEGNLVQDLIPCYRLKDGYPGMYDLVSGSFLTNKSTFNYIKAINERATYYKLAKDIYLNDGMLSVEEDTNDEALRPYKFVYTGDKDGVLYTWTPAMEPENVKNYSASIDFNGYRISGMYIDSTEDYQGFFGNLSGGYMKNGKFENFVVFGGGSIGGLRGQCNAAITNMIVDGCVIGSAARVGLIAGDGAGLRITNCTSRGFVYSSGSSVGGQVGYGFNDLYTTNCKNEAEVFGLGLVGGICGTNGYGATGGDVVNCVNSGKVTGLTSSHVGGIVGYKTSRTISGCKNYGTVKCDSNNTGGVVGYLGGGAKIENCVNYGEVRGTVRTGGVVGQRYTSQGGSEDNLTNYGNVFGTSRVAGITGFGGGSYFRNYGVIKGEGCVAGLTGEGSANDSQNYGDIYGSANYVAGLIGYSGSATRSINYGNIHNSGEYTAGLVGMIAHSVLIEDCKNFGNVFGTKYVSGFVAYINCSPSYKINMKRLSNYGNLKGDSEVKAFIAYVYRGNIYVNDCLNAGNITTGKSLSETKVNIFGTGNYTDCLSSSLINNVRKSYFIGDNFDEFCYDFRKNKYHLNEEVFQTFWIDKVSKEFLISKNFVEL